MNIVVFILITFLISVNAYAEQERELHFKRNQIKSINIVAPEWEDYTNADGTGMYWEILQTIY